MIININIKTFDKELTKIRQCFAHYLKYIYKLHKLGKTYGGNNIVMDEFFLKS